MKHLKILVLTLLMMGFTANAWCGWWIFGQSQDEVVTSYLYLNGTSFDEFAEKATIYSASLENGEILIKGKATAGKNKIALTELTLDGKETWQVMNQENGVFNFRFTPEAGKTYDLYIRITDTRGRTNNVESTHRKLLISGQNIRGLVNDALNNLVRAYQNKNSTEFMSHISSDFAGDFVNLDRAVRKDFSSFENIMLSFTINNVIASAGKVAVSITYNRSLTGIRSSTTFRDSGMTEFTFKLDNNSLSVFSMKNPLIFGLSDAAEVATGSAPNNSSTPVIIVDSQGNVSIVPFKNILSEDGGASATINFTFTK